jgi:Tfp pilus assembly protein PilV
MSTADTASLITALVIIIGFLALLGVILWAVDSDDDEGGEF